PQESGISSLGHKVAVPARLKGGFAKAERLRCQTQAGVALILRGSDLINTAMPLSSTSDPAGRLDALDEALHDLLMRRVELAGQCGPTSPAREAATMRRLAARHDGAFPLAALVRIWREIMASTPNTVPLVHVFAGDNVADYRDLARAYFGSAAAMESHPS